MSSTDLRRNPVTAPTFEDTGGLHPKWKGYKYLATADAINIFDEVVVTEKALRGGWYELLDTNGSTDDIIEFSVVDKDDVLGLFETYGLTVGEDVLELKKYVETDTVNPNTSGMREIFMAKSTFVVVAGLYMRTVYDAAAGSDRCFKVVQLAYE
jgi:hypothetical protein